MTTQSTDASLEAPLIRSYGSKGATLLDIKKDSASVYETSVMTQSQYNGMKNKKYQGDKQVQYSTPKTWANSLIFRRSKLSASSGSQNNCSCFHQPKPQAVQVEAESEETNNDKSQGSDTRRSFLAHDFCHCEEKIDLFLPEFHKCILVGDNFFLNVAVMELGFRMVNRGHVLQSGFCASGMTIAEATENIASIAPNNIILLYIGSVDIIEGMDLIDMVCAMIRLMNVCILYNIKPILTTLLPLANYRQRDRVAVTDGFNEFLMKNPFDFPVIELHNLFLKSNGTMNSHYYETRTGFVSGMKKPISLWSMVGRKRVLKRLKQELGSAVLKILIK